MEQFGKIRPERSLYAFQTDILVSRSFVSISDFSLRNTCFYILKFFVVVVVVVDCNVKRRNNWVWTMTK